MLFSDNSIENNSSTNKKCHLTTRAWIIMMDGLALSLQPRSHNKYYIKAAYDPCGIIIIIIIDAARDRGA